MGEKVSTVNMLRFFLLIKDAIIESYFPRKEVEVWKKDGKKALSFFCLS